MKLWPFKRKHRDEVSDEQEPDDQVWTIIATPYAGIVHQFQSLGLTGGALVAAVQMVESGVCQDKQANRYGRK